MKINNAEKLLYYRKLYGITRRELASSTGVSMSTVKNLESGASNGNEESWKRISDYFESIKIHQYRHNVKSGRELYKARQDMGISRDELATRTGISYSMICSIENEKKNGSVETWNKINAYLDIDYSESNDILARLRKDMKEHGKDVLVNVKVSRVNYRLFSVDDYEICTSGSNDGFITKANNLYELLHYDSIKKRRKK